MLTDLHRGNKPYLGCSDRKSVETDGRDLIVTVITA